MNTTVNGRSWTAWAAIVPLGMLLFFFIIFLLGVLRLAYDSVAAGAFGSGLLFLLLMGPIAAWPAWRCWQGIAGYYTGRERFTLTINRRNIIIALVLLSIFCILVGFAINYTIWVSHRG